MRFKVFLDVQIIPQMYRMYLLSFIKDMIRKGDQELYEQLYNGTKNPKPFTFSLYMKDFHLNKESQQYKLKDATLIFSTSNPTIGVAFFNGLSQTDKFTHPEYPFKITSKEIGREQLIKSDVAAFSILNSVLLEDKNKKPILFTDSNFEKELNVITNKQFQSLYGRELYEPLKIHAHKLKKQVIKETNRHADGKVLYYTAQKGDLVLQGNPKDLQLIYQDGLGLRRSQGFGLLEVQNHG